MAENEALNTARGYAQLVRQNMDTEAIYLYGSYARGTASRDSDIDIAVVVSQVQTDYLAAVSKLWKLTRAVSDEIEPVLLIAGTDDSGFLRSLQETGIAV